MPCVCFFFFLDPLADRTIALSSPIDQKKLPFQTHDHTGCFGLVAAAIGKVNLPARRGCTSPHGNYVSIRLCVVRYNSLGSSRSPCCNYRSLTQERAICEEAAAVYALSGKMIQGTVRFCARGASPNGHDAPTIRHGSCSCHLSAALLVRAAFPIRSSPRRRSRPSHLGARSGGCDLGWHRFVVDRCQQRAVCD